jgi:hypothetical protein
MAASFVRSLLVSAVLASAALYGIGCSSSDSRGGGSADGSTGTGESGNAGGGGASGSGTGAAGCSGTTAQGVSCSLVTGNTQCSNGKDDDGDGLVDGFDPECTGPLDNDESSFATGIPGDNVDPKWQDCFFDGNSGAGDDGCRYSTDCLTGKLPQTDPSCKLSTRCVNFCAKYTPNGCDCFGCCTIATARGEVTVQIGSSCSLDQANDPSACPVCVKSTQCGNDCGTCELCLGKTAADLPPSCTPKSAPDGAPPPPAYTCDGGEQVCSATPSCPAGFYCQLGCCMPLVQ